LRTNGEVGDVNNFMAVTAPPILSRLFRPLAGAKPPSAQTALTTVGINANAIASCDFAHTLF
jgi:hypothetical protein